MSQNKQNIEETKIYEENYSKSPNNDYHIRKTRCKSRSKSWSKSRSRSKSKSKNKSKIKKYNPAYNYLSKETKRKNSKELMSISDFIISSNPKDEKYIETLFNKKNISKKLLIENKDLDLEQINFDNTLHEYQQKYLAILINNINKDINNIESSKEKIIKCGIVLSEEEFKNELSKINDKKLISDVDYQNFKTNLIKCLDYLLKYEEKEDYDEDIFCARKILGIQKDYEFNNFIDISEENYYYYRLSYDLYNNIEKILINYYLYYNLLSNFKNFILKNNLNELNEEQKSYFEIIKYYLLDKDSLKNIKDLEKLEHYLSEKNLSVENIKKKIGELNSNYNKKIYPNFHISINDNYIEYNYEMKIRLPNKKTIIDKFSSKFELNSFSNIFNDISTNDLYYTLDNAFYNSLIYTKTKSHNKFFYDLIPLLKKAILNITKSRAFKEFFKKNYAKNYPQLKYDFDKEEVINEFFNRITLIKIINPEMNAFGDPVDLKIYLPINPGEIKNLHYISEIKLLRFGRYLILLVHELLGHMMRKYYYYISNGQVRQNTNEDKKMNWGEEGGYYIEKKFLGKEFRYISVKDIICLLIPKNDYPILEKNDLNKNDLEYIVEEYKDLFDFIIQEKDFNNGIISIDDYYLYLTIPPFSSIKPNIYSYTSFIEIY